MGILCLLVDDGHAYVLGNVMVSIQCIVMSYAAYLTMRTAYFVLAKRVSVLKNIFRIISPCHLFCLSAGDGTPSRHESPGKKLVDRDIRMGYDKLITVVEYDSLPKSL